MAVTGSKRIRWALLVLLFFSTVMNYLDRQALSILATTMQVDLRMSDLAYAHVVQLFLLAYTCAYLFAGRMTDRLGSKIALTIFAAWWSIANLLSGLARTVGELGAARFALGLGEPGNYTVGSKVVSEHFPPRERGLAFGIYTAGAMVGATLAPPLIGGLALTHGWRAAFIATGAAGLLWTLIWWLVHPRENRPAPSSLRTEGILWGALLRDRSMWLLVLSRAIADPVAVLLPVAVPEVSQRRARHDARIDRAGVDRLAADIGSLGGGAISSRLVARGMDPIRSRLVAMTMAAVIAPVGIFAALHPSLPLLFAIASCVAFAHLVFQINISALVVDLYPTRYIATVFGLISAVGMLDPGRRLARRGQSLRQHVSADVRAAPARVGHGVRLVKLARSGRDGAAQLKARCALERSASRVTTAPRLIAIARRSRPQAELSRPLRRAPREARVGDRAPRPGPVGNRWWRST